VNDASIKIAVSAVTGRIGSAVDRTGAKPGMGWAGVGPEGGNVSASGHVVVSTVAANARNLNDMLINLNYVGLMGISIAVNAGVRGVKRTEDRDWSVHLQSGEEAVAAIAGAIIASVNRGMR